MEGRVYVLILLLMFNLGLVFGTGFGLWCGWMVWNIRYAGHHLEYWRGWDDRYDSMTQVGESS